MALLMVLILAWRMGAVLALGTGVVAALVLLGQQGRRYREGLAMLREERAAPAPGAILALGGTVFLLAFSAMLALVSGA